METRRIVDGIDLYFPPEEADIADLFEAACERTVPIIGETWELPTPKRCRVYVMTSWLHFIFHSAPWHMRILWRTIDERVVRHFSEQEGATRPDAACSAGSGGETG